jgi:hypothetical protein
MENINVLIVDDQINVVSGVMFGVHWDRLWSGQTQKVLAGVAVGLVLAHGDVVVEDVDALQTLVGEAGGYHAVRH